MATKTDGTAWVWGLGAQGQLGLNEAFPAWPNADARSPMQIPGTNWVAGKSGSFGQNTCFAIKSDNTMWSWGENEMGELGHNNTTQYSSPTQIPGTWDSLGLSSSGAGGGDGLEEVWVLLDLLILHQIHVHHQFK